MHNPLEEIYRSGLRFLEPMSLEEVSKVIVHEAMKLVKGEEGKLVLMENGNFRLLYTSHLGESYVIPRKKGFVYTAFSKQKAFFIHTADHPRIHPEAAKVGVKSALFIPLFNRKMSIGVLVIQSYKEKQFSERELNILKLFGNMASLAIKKAQLYQEIEEALETRDLFISMASHELRTPLTTINGYVSLLYSKLKDTGTNEARWIEELSWETYRMTLLVKELLEVNKIKSGELDYHWKECRFSDIVERAVKNFQFSFPERRVEFEANLINGQDIIIGDYDKLLQVVNNVLENAGKFSSLNQRINISLKSKAQCLALTIKDEGHGIKKDDLSKIFDSYYTGSNHQREGMGLGLYLSKYIIERHRGTISVRSKPAKGTAVQIKLPMIKQ